MITVEFDELELNAVRAALGERVAKMSRQLADLRELRDSSDNRFALETTHDAIRYATRAQQRIVELIDERIAAEAGVTRWVRLDDTFAHLFPTGDGYTRSLCKRITWTSALRAPYRDSPTCPDCAAAALAKVPA